jgi:small subunit ribosomal protein S13
MVRIAGVDLPNAKRLDIALTYIYGIGRSNVVRVLKTANIEANRRVQTLTEEETRRITKALDSGYTIEGDLRQERAQNIKRLKEINTYRGIRHTKNLPVRGQQTRTNARTKRGKRVTIGAMKKDDRVKLDRNAPSQAPTGETA